MFQFFFAYTEWDQNRMQSVENQANIADGPEYDVSRNCKQYHHNEYIKCLWEKRHSWRRLLIFVILECYTWNKIFFIKLKVDLNNFYFCATIFGF